MPKTIKLVKRSATSYFVVMNDVMNVGEVYMEADGFYVWEMPRENRGGYLPSIFLKELAELIEELNKPWDEKIQKYFENN